MRRLFPVLMALAAPVVGVLAAVHFGAIGWTLHPHSGTPAPQALAVLTPALEPPAETVPEDPKGSAPVVPEWASPPPVAAKPLPSVAARKPPVPASRRHNPNVRQATVRHTVCTGGYSRQVRRRLKREKRRLMADAGIPWSEAGAWRLDHRVPLCLGGSTRDRSNMILQPKAEAARKDRLELKLHCLVCSGQVTLAEARSRIAGDWQAAYHRYAKVKCRRARAHRPRDHPR